jgi:predicted Holliday junction resolvase-like endonuclease
LCFIYFLKKSDTEKKYQDLNKQYISIQSQIESRAIELKEKWINDDRNEYKKVIKQRAVNQLIRWRNEHEASIRDQKDKMNNEMTKLKNEHDVSIFNLEEKMKNQMVQWIKENESRIRNDAIKRSGEVIKGKITEHLVPYFPNFPYNPKDARFLGTPIDIIIFDGLSENNVKEIIFVEIKTGKTGHLTPREKSVKDCIESAGVKYNLIHLKNE